MSGSSARPSSRQTKPRRAGATANVEPFRRLPRLEHGRVRAAEQRLLAQRLAAMRERDDDVELLPQQAVQLVLGLGQPAGGERRALRVERERLTLRQRRQLGRAVE